MYTPGLTCRVSTREASRSLRGRLTDDIRLPKATKTANDAAIGTHLAVPSGICARVADGALHTLSPLRGSPAGPHRSRAARTRPPRTQPDGSLLVSDQCNPSEVPGSLRCHLSAHERQGPSYLSSCGRLRRHRQRCYGISHHPPLTARAARLPGAEDRAAFRDPHRRIPQAVAPLSTVLSGSASRR